MYHGLSITLTAVVYLILKPHSQSSRSPVRPLLSKAKLSCIYSILKPHGQSFKSQVRLLVSKVKPSYTYFIIKPHIQSFRNSNRLHCKPFDGRFYWIFLCSKSYCSSMVISTIWKAQISLWQNYIFYWYIYHIYGPSW